MECLMKRTIGFVFKAGFFCGFYLLASLSFGAPILFSGLSVDGHPVSGSAEFTLNAGADTVTVKLTNTTTLTNDAGELFTGLDFTLGGLTPSMNTATGDTGIQRSVDSAGGFTDTGSPQNLGWALVSLGSGDYQLKFNGSNAKGSIIGPPSGGNYSAATNSIKNNNGHNPFAAEMASFTLSVPNLEANTPVVAKVFRYGTGLDPATGTIVPPGGGGIPEPASLVLLLMGAAGALGRRLRS
jgi:hypothetical protein